MQTIANLCLLFGLLQVHGRVIDNTKLSSEEEACVDELNLDKRKIQRQNNLDSAPENDEDFGQFLSCSYKKIGWQDSNGAFNLDELISSMTNYALSEIEDENDPTLIFTVKLTMQTVIIGCENGLSEALTPEASVVKLQNCIVSTLDEISTDK